MAIDEERFPGRQGRLLFAYLVAEQGRPVPRDELAEALWGGTPPATWDKALTVIVSRLRGLLANTGGALRLTAAFGCYRLDLPEGAWVDVLDAAGAAQEGEEALAAAELERAKEAASRAVALVRQPFLPGEDAAWVDEKRRELAHVRVRALDVLTEAFLQSGDAVEAAKWAEQAVAGEPYRETGYRRLMEAHAAAGNRAEALRVYERCRLLLAEELGAYPSPETDSIYRGLLAAPARPEPPSRGSEHPGETPDGLTRAGRHRLLLAGVAAVTALVIAGAAVLVTRGGSSAPTAIVPDSIAVVDALHNSVVADVPLHTRPAAVAYGAGSLWVATTDDETLLQIDPRTRRVTRTIGLGVTPSTIAAAGRYVWVLGDGVLLQFNVYTGTRLRKVGLGGTARVGPLKGQPLPTLERETIPAYDLAAGGGAAWIAYGFGIVARVDARTGAVEQIPAGSSFGIAFGDGAAWSVSGEWVGPPFGTISRIDARTRMVTQIPTADAGAGADVGVGHGVAAGPNGVWAVSMNTKHAWKIDPNLSAVVAVIPLDHPPKDVAIGAGTAWLANADGTISRLDNRRAAVVATISFGRDSPVAYPVDLTTGAGRVWVALH